MPDKTIPHVLDPPILDDIYNIYIYFLLGQIVDEVVLKDGGFKEG